ncbi:MAG: hypothetical protein HQL39_16335 [Alphaproteobacteria bacterium]|nr:hypothetical protein [Alphaproteobacteria bacterium]
MEALGATSNNEQEAVVRDCLVAWSGIADSSGAALACTEDGKASLFRWSFHKIALGRAFMRAQSGAISGN